MEVVTKGFGCYKAVTKSLRHRGHGEHREGKEPQITADERRLIQFLLPLCVAPVFSVSSVFSVAEHRSSFRSGHDFHRNLKRLIAPSNGERHRVPGIVVLKGSFKLRPVFYRLVIHLLNHITGNDPTARAFRSLQSGGGGGTVGEDVDDQRALHAHLLRDLTSDAIV